ncbi:TrmH family RNA methyltransferase [Cohnella thailandensis]|uniref:RNA methyltransferase n=1 Tax=Cohnella thailandensis TaxID=557557 RepID=A0A841SK41_9BACL|nr:RNA methyltransferase [Cohnella thailandensis]MBB6632893.1 RNA methyltransferase [Cohnella thailandensis]MBP1975414.1 TrmH family RNA methyltransferase [Cohnella thailandensis]
MRNLEPALTSLANPRVKGWAKLSERKNREKEGRFKLEGVHLVAEALASGWPLECVVFEEGMGVPEELLAYADNQPSSSSSPSWIPVSPDIIAKCVETETPQPVFAVAYRKPVDREALFAEGAGPVVVLDGVQDPGNVGTIVRSAAASGASAVVLGKGTADLYNAKTLRSTMGTLFYLPVLEADLTELLPEARRHGKTLYGTSLQATKSCYEVELGRDAWLLFGNEGSGLSPKVEELVDRPIIIPMTGKAESLNVAMAATVLLFEAQRQRMALER